jgi:hypothetical protein
VAAVVVVAEVGKRQHPQAEEVEEMGEKFFYSIM